MTPVRKMIDRLARDRNVQAVSTQRRVSAVRFSQVLFRGALDRLMDRASIPGNIDEAVFTEARGLAATLQTNQ